MLSAIREKLQFLCEQIVSCILSLLLNLEHNHYDHLHARVPWAEAVPPIMLW
uniref:Uncharacterized protein n=1 Tax=Triticum urartu TaxID=4572 RepID=A0A8R7URB6_TRIUA